MDSLKKKLITLPSIKLTVLAIALAGGNLAFAEGIQFNPSFIENINGVENVDLSQFSIEEVRELPGVYRVDIFINDEYFDTMNIDFVSRDATDDSGNVDKVLLPCLNYNTLDRLGVKLSAFPELDKYSTHDESSNTVVNPDELTTEAGACVPFTQAIPSSSVYFDIYLQRLNLSIPHAAMRRDPQGYVDPSRWDDGIIAAFTDYYYSGAHNRIKNKGRNSETNNDQYLNLRSGINIGAWRLRNYANAFKDDDGTHWKSINTYVERGIISIKSRLNIGDYYTSGDIFEGFQFRGIQLANDNDMLPDSLKGYAPVVRGIANTHAQVSVRQNGYVIYQTYVSPGAFLIDDLYPTSASGNLEVEVREADGSINRFLVPFASTPMMLREGRYNYSLTAGKYRSGNHDYSEPKFVQGTLTRGMALGFSLYGGAQFGDDYKSGALGIGKNLGDLGAISFDVTHASSKINHENKHGQSLRFLYGKSFAVTQTDLRLFGYRYSTSDYFTFQESVDLDNDAINYTRYYNKRSKIQASVTQGLNGYGSVYASVSRQDFWKRDGKEELIQLGYNGSNRYFNYGLAYSYSKVTDYNDNDQRFSLSISMPLDRFIKNSWLSYNVSTQRHGATTNNLALSGTALDHRNLEYSVQQNYTDGGGTSSNYGGAVNLNYRGAYGNAGVGYNYSDDNRQINYSLQGGIVLHSDGITLAQPLGETFALVKAEGASSTKIYNNDGVRTDWRGYTVVPYINPYRTSRIELDASSLDHHVDLMDGAVEITPTRGAIVKADFDTRIGYRALITLERPDGMPVPFGASATIISEENNKKTKEENMAIVSENSELYISGLPAKGQLKIQWGKAGGQTCTVNYELPESVIKNKNLPTNESLIVTFNAPCI